MKNKLLLAGAFLSALAVFSTPVMADDLHVRPIIRDIRQDRRDLHHDLRRVRAHRAHRFFTGQISAINGTTLTVTHAGKTHTVNTSSTTVFRRGNGQVASLSDLSVGNTVHIRGSKVNSTTANANLIVDSSI